MKSLVTRLFTKGTLIILICKHYVGLKSFPFVRLRDPPASKKRHLIVRWFNRRGTTRGDCHEIPASLVGVTYEVINAGRKLRACLEDGDPLRASWCIRNYISWARLTLVHSHHLPKTYRYLIRAFRRCNWHDMNDAIISFISLYLTVTYTYAT